MWRGRWRWLLVREWIDYLDDEPDRQSARGKSAAGVQFPGLS
jgi:hypothetical protein